MHSIYEAWASLLKKFKDSLKAQLYALATGIAVVSWLTFYWGHLHSEHSNLEQIHRQSTALVMAFSEQSQHSLDLVNLGLAEVGLNATNTTNAMATAIARLDALFADQNYRLSVVDPAGRVIFDHAKSGPPTAWPAPGHMPPSDKSDLLVIRQARIDTASKGEFIQLIRPIQTSLNTTHFVVLAVAPQFFLQFFQKLDPSIPTVLAVLQPDGTVLAQTETLTPFGDLLPLDVDAVRRISTLDGRDYMLGLRPFPAYGITVAAGIDVAHLMEPDRLRKHIVFVFAMVLSAVLLISTRSILGGLARRQALEKTMRASEQLAASVFTHAREGIVITDTDGTILDINSTFTHITGYSRQEAMGQNPRILKSDRQGPEFYAAMWSDLTSKGYWTGDIWNRHKNGALYAALLTISVVRDASGKSQHYVALFTDITDIKDHQRQIAHMAHYDALSNLPNRILLVDRLRQAMLQCRRRNHCLAVAFLDLDSFKDVNDTYGNDVGDAMLIAVARNMRSALRDGDTLARLGGDEFVAVLVDLDTPEECYPVLKRLLEAASMRNTVSVARSDGAREVQLKVSASIGFTLYPQDNVDADQLLRQADHAMYQAKLAGKNRFHLFDVVHDAALKLQTESLERIRQGLEGHEFVLYFQPKVNMKSGETVGVEALIRWQHPERGLLSPNQFLPLIENHPLSIAVGEWVINTALDHMCQWKADGLDIAISVNVGARQLQQDAFAERLAQFLAAHPSVAPTQLELEILETNAMEDMATVTENILGCRALGVGFALDDFGSGYSSLTYLKRLPVDLLKIDQSFVRDMLEDADDLAIVKSIISLAATFHRSVIAEGVETTAHGELLMQLGCYLAQGFGIARPMPAAELPRWVAQRKAHRRSGESALLLQT